MHHRVLKILFFTISSAISISYCTAQHIFPVEIRKEQNDIQKVSAKVINGDTMPYYRIRTVWVYPKFKFKNKKQERFYWRTVRDVKVVLPITKEIRQIIEETNDTLLTMKTKRERDRYMRGFEKKLYKREEGRMKKLTLRQGMLLIRLVDRECDASGYELIKAYRGSFRAGFYELFAKLFGASLKTRFGDDKNDHIIERIINLVESGQL